VRLNKLSIFEFTITANNYNRTINWVSYFISRLKNKIRVIRIIREIRGQNIFALWARI